MSDDKKLMETVRLLLARAEHPNTPPEEADAALRRANALIGRACRLRAKGGRAMKWVRCPGSGKDRGCAWEPEAEAKYGATVCECSYGVLLTRAGVTRVHHIAWEDGEPVDMRYARAPR